MDGSYPAGGWASYPGLKFAGFVGVVALFWLAWFPHTWYEWVVPSVALIYLASRFPGSPAGSLLTSLAIAFVWIPPAVALLQIFRLLR